MANLRFTVRFLKHLYFSSISVCPWAFFVFLSSSISQKMAAPPGFLGHFSMGRKGCCILVGMPSGLFGITVGLSFCHRKIPPAAEPPSHLVSSLPSAPLSPSPTGSSPRLPGPPPRPTCPASTPPTKDSLVPSYPAGSPNVAAACSQAECIGGSQAITSPLPANTPSPSFSKLPPSKASKSSKGKDRLEVEAPSRKRKLSPGPTTFKRTCILEPTGKGKPSGCRGLTAKTKPALGLGLNGTVGPRVKRAGPLDCRGSPHQPPTPVKASQLDSQGVAGHAAKALPTNCLSEEEVAKKRKNLATYCRPVKAKHCQAGAPADAACSMRRKKPGPALAFEEKCSTLQVPAWLPEDRGRERVRMDEVGVPSRNLTERGA